MNGIEDTRIHKCIKHKLLLTFYVVAQEQSITQAAKRLFISQPAVSLQIKALETELGHVLFERHGPKITLNAEGHKLFIIVQPIIMQLQALKGSFADSLNDIENGEINIAAGFTTSSYILPSFIKRFKEEHPNIKIRLNYAAGDDLIDYIKNDRVDLAVGHLRNAPSGINFSPFMTYNTSLICSKDHPLAKKDSISLADISEYKLIMPPRSLRIWRNIEEVFSKHKLSYFIDIEVGNWETVKKYVSLNLGVSIIDDASLIDNQDLHCVPLDQYFAPKHYGLISRKTKFFSAQTREFIKLFDTDLETEHEAAS